MFLHPKNMFCSVAELNLTMYFLYTEKIVMILLIHYITLLICDKVMLGYDHKSNLLPLILVLMLTTE